MFMLVPHVSIISWTYLILFGVCPILMLICLAKHGHLCVLARRTLISCNHMEQGRLRLWDKNNRNCIKIWFLRSIRLLQYCSVLLLFCFVIYFPMIKYFDRMETDWEIKTAEACWWVCGQLYRRNTCWLVTTHTRAHTHARLRQIPLAGVGASFLYSGRKWIFDLYLCQRLCVHVHTSGSVLICWLPCSRVPARVAAAAPGAAQLEALM